MRWPETITIAQAREMQEKLKRKVRVAPLRKEPRFVAGVDAAFSDQEVFAAACLYSYPGLAFRKEAHTVEKLRFPYVPGFLSFREGPAIIAALRKLRQPPDVILVDGQGIAHPRGIGIASFLGVLLDTPTIGCAKTRLVGEFSPPRAKKGMWSELRFEGRTVGAVLRTREGVKPLFVSPGHLVDLESSIAIVLSCVWKYRIPEPLRCADMLSKKIKSP
jgi:deoxyribonuclease V